MWIRSELKVDWKWIISGLEVDYKWIGSGLKEDQIRIVLEVDLVKRVMFLI